MRTGAVIAAAGVPQERENFKPFIRLGSLSSVGRIIANFQQAGVYPVVVVTGCRAAELEKHVSRMGAVCVRNRDYEHSDMLASAKLGFSFIKDLCDRVFFTPSDIPLFTADTIKKMCETDARAAKPVCSGAGGHPVLINCGLIPYILEYSGAGGLRGALAACCGDVCKVDVQDEGVIYKASADENGELVKKHTRRLFRPVVEVSLMSEGKLLDRQSAALLRMTEYEGTVKEACEKLGMSYSKAWNMLSALEENLGFALIERRPGGECGGTSCLTAEGSSLLEKYEEYTKAVRAFAERSFDEYFGGI